MQEFEKGWPEGFRSTISKKVKTVSDSKKHIKVGSQKVYDTSVIYSRVIGIQASSRDIDIKKVLSHELAPVPTMFHDSDAMRICKAKSDLKKRLAKEGSSRCSMFNVVASVLHGNVNVDAKIISNAIANRIKKILPNIIHHNQTVYVKDQFIGETKIIQSILDVMEFTEKKKLPGLLIFIDFQKAFDTLEWNFLAQCLSFFNSGPDFMRWIRTFYRHIQSCVINNGLSSNYFNLTRGVRQGDPLSPYLFLLAVEILAIAVRDNFSIKGITIEDEETKLLQYADDTTAVLSGTDSAHILFKLLDKFGTLSGLQINSSKTEGMWIGSSKNNVEKPLGIKWPSGPIKALGVVFPHDDNQLCVKNFDEKLDSIKKQVNIWSPRELSTGK